MGRRDFDSRTGEILMAIDAGTGKTIAGGRSPEVVGKLVHLSHCSGREAGLKEGRRRVACPCCHPTVG